MEVPLFYTHSIINGKAVVKTLIDNGSQAYASIREDIARKNRFELLDITPRQAIGWTSSNSAIIQQVASFEFDVGGIGRRKAWAYVVPNQGEDLILGRAWIKAEGASINEQADFISFEWTDAEIKNEANNSWKVKASQLKINQIMSSTYGALHRRAKKDKSIQFFAASLADIEKALKPKVQLSVHDIKEKLPKHYWDFIPVFSPHKAQELPPYRPGIDHEIPIELDDKGNKKEVPWGPLYNMSRDELLVLRKELTRLLDNDFIEVSKSPAAAPVLFAKKPGGGLRFCVDYRGLNAITRKDRYPLPLIRETLAALSKAKWLTKFDVSAAFHRIRIAKGEEWKTAFRTRYGLYQWKVMPFGLTGAPATFQRYINWVLREYLDDFCTAYIDDILVFSSGSLEDHRAKVRKVLSKLQDAGLYLDISKSEFETKQVKYLGYIIEVGVGVRMDPEKIRAIADWKPPTSVKGVRSFLGFANYYRLFIERYTTVALPLTNLTHKNTEFKWGQDEQTAFEKLKSCFVAEPVLASYDPNKDTRVEPDSSGWACGGVLSQFDADQQLWKPVAYFSTKHLPAECNYDIKEKELLAIIKCLREWRSELVGLSKPFTILTDHKNLEGFEKKKLLSERQVRWAEFLSGFNFKLQHRPGKQAILSDTLSRREQDMPQDAQDERITEREQILLPKELWGNQSLQINPAQVTDSVPAPFVDKELVQLWEQALESPDSEQYKGAREAVSKEQRKFPKDLGLQLSIGECDICDSQLRFRERLWIPGYEPLTTRIIQQTHDSVASGHPGRDTTIALLSRQFFWPGMNAQARRFIRNCDVCGRSTIWRDKKKGLLKPLPIPDRIWQEISMDFVTDLPPTPETKSTVLLVITDRLGKGTILLEVPPDQWDAEGVANIFLARYIPFHWLPRGIVSDRGPQWVNMFWKRVCELLKIERRLSTAYHPETDGSTERRNQEIETYLRAFVAYTQENWGKLLPLAQIALDNRPASATGISPFFLSHGYNAEPIQLQEEVESQPNKTPAGRGLIWVQRMKEAQDYAQAAMAVAQQQQEYYANQRREPTPAYKVGDKVWLNLKNIHTSRPCKKLDWIHGKYTVTRVFKGQPHFYEVDVPGHNRRKFHISLLRPAANDALPSQQQDDSQPPPVITKLGDEEYGVEEILRARTKRYGRGSRREVLVKWLGYAQPSWHPLSDFEETAALDAFEARYGNALQNDGPLQGEEEDNVTG
jgi:hypothetical protein